MRSMLVAAGALLLAAAGCRETEGGGDGADPAARSPIAGMPATSANQLLSQSPLGPVPPSPTNAVADDPAAAALGRRLFFEPGLSPGGTVSCASCHDPDHGFSTADPLSKGLGTTDRHAPSLWNAGYNRWQFWDGRADTLWAQAIKPMEHPAEMGSNRLHVARQVTMDAALAAAYGEVYGPPPALDDRSRFPAAARPVSGDPDHPHAVSWAAMAPADRKLVNDVLVNMTKAIAAFERTIVSDDAPFDRYAAAVRAGSPDPATAMGAAAVRGARLFFGRANCFLCHNGPNFSDREFHNVLPATAPVAPASIDRGRYDGIPRVQADPFNAGGAYSDDPGAQQAKLVRRLVRSDEQLGQFKTPSLRNVALSPPYMHDGRFATLREVVEFYNELPGQPPIGHREEFMRPLGLSGAEIEDLVAFLEALTDDRRLPGLRPPAE